VKFGVVVFPGTNCDRDTVRALETVGAQAELLWHGTDQALDGCDGIILPGGFAHGDALRAGALARFSAIMPRVIDFAAAGRPVLGICNGFQVLVECGLLPGALLRNASLQFRAGWVHCRVERPIFGALHAGTILRLPIAHGMGNYVADPIAAPDVALRYCSPSGEITPEANPNGSYDNVAGVMRANVFGLMPHPERAVCQLLGSTDGRVLFEALVRALVAA